MFSIVPISAQRTVSTPNYECAPASPISRRRYRRAVGAAVGGIGLMLSMAPVATAVRAQALPPGALVAWSKSAADIPADWKISNGKDGTIDLVGKYIKGTTSGAELNQAGGHSETTVAGEHTPSVSTAKGKGTWSLNPKLGSTKFNPVGEHKHGIDPAHLSVAFILAPRGGANTIPEGAIAFIEADIAPVDWVKFPSDKMTTKNLLLLGSETPSDKVAGGTLTLPGGDHTPSITAKGGKMSLNPGAGSTSFNKVAAHTHPYSPPYRKLTAIRNTKDTATVPDGLIVPWIGAPAAVPPGWALCNGAGSSTPDLNGRFVIIAPDSLEPPDGGNDATGSAGKHKFGISTGKGGKMSLNPKFGWTGPNETAAHQHKVDDGPPHVKLPFIKFMGQ